MASCSSSSATNFNHKRREILGEEVDLDVGDDPLQVEGVPISEFPEFTETHDLPIAMSTKFVSFGLNGGEIMVCKREQTDITCLLSGHDQKIFSLAFQSEKQWITKDAAEPKIASIGRNPTLNVWEIMIWELSETGCDQICGRRLFFLRLTKEVSTHALVCWNPVKRESLYVSIGKVVLSIDTKEGSFLGPEIPVINIKTAGKRNGIEFIARHADDVTVMQVDENFGIAHLLSGSNDGMIKITKEDTGSCVASFKAHDGKAIHSSNFIRHLTDLVLITGGPENQELKLWIPAGEKTSWLSNGFDSWKCMQTLGLRSSEDEFASQLIALPKPGLLLVAIAKKDQIYSVHLDFGNTRARAADIRMRYLSKFRVSMPILSFVGDLREEQSVKLYCVHTLAIKQYTFDLGLEKSESLFNKLVLNPPTKAISKELNDMLEKAIQKESKVFNEEIGKTIKKEGKELTDEIEKTIKNEFDAKTPAFRNLLSSAIRDIVQEEIHSSVINKLETSVLSKIGTLVSTAVREQMDTLGKRAIWDSLRTSAIPVFEKLCQEMFRQVDSAFKEGLSKYACTAEERFDKTNSKLVKAVGDLCTAVSLLRESLMSLTSQPKTLAGQIGASVELLKEKVQVLDEVKTVLASSELEAEYDNSKIERVRMDVEDSVRGIESTISDLSNLMKEKT